MGASGKVYAVNVQPELLHLREAQLSAEAAVHSLAWEGTVNTPPRQHVIVFRKE